jgi:peptide/nickel transport system permease protein
MARYVAGRFVTGVVTVLVVTILVFGAMRLAPGSYAEVVLGPFSSQEMRANLTKEYGLDQPVPEQYLKWLGHAVEGNFGTSLETHTPVSELLARRLPVTAELTLLSLLITLLVGLPLALLAALARSRLIGGSSRLLGAVAMSTPDFVLGSVLVYLFSQYSLGLPVGQYVPFFDDPVESIRGMLLPAITLSVFGIAILVRTGRDAVAAVLSSPHVTAAVARGESRAHIVRHHLLRNAAIPVVTVVATFVGYLLGGAVIVENLFSLPGLGQAALTAVKSRDYAVVQGVVLIAATAFIAVNMFADFTYGLIDPRILDQDRA